MIQNRPVESIFFFIVFGLVGYLIWEIISPFVGILSLAAIIATVCYPLFLRIRRVMPWKNESFIALCTILLVGCTVFIPIIVLAYVLFMQALAFYDRVNSGAIGIQGSLQGFEDAIQRLAPGASLELTNYAQEGAQWFASHMGTIFAGTASTVFLSFVFIVAMFYFLRDGRAFTAILIRLSPLPDDQDELIVNKLSMSVRSVVLGTLAVALIQGILTAIGFWIFQIDQPVLWGSVAAIGALIPGVGTSLVFLGVVIFSLLAGHMIAAIGLTLWGVIAVGLIDNILGPYLISRGGELHPFLILLSVLGGVALFGPIGFLIGPVVLSLFTVLLELYNIHVRRHA